MVNLPVEEFTPLIGMISRLTDEKGLDLLEATILPLLEQNIQLVVMGIGDQHYHEMFQRLACTIRARWRYGSRSTPS